MRRQRNGIRKWIASHRPPQTVFEASPPRHCELPNLSLDAARVQPESVRYPETRPPECVQVENRIVLPLEKGCRQGPMRHMPQAQCGYGQQRSPVEKQEAGAPEEQGVRSKQ